jgi:endonuclease-8
VPEGDTLRRTADGLRPYLVGRPVTAAVARAPGPRADLLVGATVTAVEAVGKNLLIDFDNGLELRTHLRLHGSWHRYRPGERWRRAPSRARFVIEVPDAVAVCFDAPTVELYEQRAAGLHPALSKLGPDLLADDYDAADGATKARLRLRDPARARQAIGEALLDQRALAGIGNVVKNETLFVERVSPFTEVGGLDDATLDRLVATARSILQAAASRSSGPERVTTGGPGRAASPLWVYDRAGRPCLRCGTLIRVARQGTDLPRTTYWCPTCQPPPEIET